MPPSWIGVKQKKSRAKERECDWNASAGGAEPWEEVAVYESPEGVMQPRPYSIKPT
jgi:hypothetical protein